MLRSVGFGLSDPRLWMSVLFLAAMTYGLAHSGIDAWVNDLARHQSNGFSLAWSAFPMPAGMVVPVFVPLVCVLKQRPDMARATLVAFLVSLIAVSVLKSLTSRVHPEALEAATSLAKSQVFRIGFLEAGFLSLVEGWPSGHTATNGAVGLVLARKTAGHWMASLALAWTVWVALATIFGISGDVHWLSDTLAGLALAVLIAQRISSAEFAVS